jgi:hypothetical protein
MIAALIPIYMITLIDSIGFMIMIPLFLWFIWSNVDLSWVFGRALTTIAQPAPIVCREVVGIAQERDLSVA